MCYSVYLSTPDPQDLARRSSPLVRFERLADDSDAVVALLEYTNRWHVGSKSICSCTFRHLHSVELGFGEPVDWSPEEQDEIAATLELYAVLADLLSSGHRLDLLDTWEGATPSDIVTLDVSLDEVSPAAFRLFENYRFRLRRGSNRP